MQAFYQDDEYSRQLPGKKDYVSIAKGVHQQKRLVLCNLHELFVAFNYSLMILVQMCLIGGCVLSIKNSINRCLIYLSTPFQQAQAQTVIAVCGILVRCKVAA